MNPNPQIKYNHENIQLRLQIIRQLWQEHG